ncbi:MAG: hypothetical protein R3C26_23590 [Calditrichia bacterium]
MKNRYASHLVLAALWLMVFSDQQPDDGYFTDSGNIATALKHQNLFRQPHYCIRHPIGNTGVYHRSYFG